ncbi:hypothetical protein [Neptunomonas phycophila]|uniref:hypothetical protein n=1 Tax=Neptunomonas phycophila TaxID=1572645 RepID=UPI0015C08A8B|nr:hypothetical protein [Neptunomonas phycophila]QLE98921.1 hypothetical protein FLM49_15495 [Neptunomonas phycophila]
MSLRTTLPFICLIIPILIGLSVYYTDFYEPKIQPAFDEIKTSGSESSSSPQIQAIERKLESLVIPTTNFETESRISEANKLINEANTINDLITLSTSQDSSPEPELRKKLESLKARTQAIQTIIE